MTNGLAVWQVNQFSPKWRLFNASVERKIETFS